MGFAAELKDFVAGFKTGSEIRNRSRESRVNYENKRLPGDSDLAGQEDPFEGGGGAIPQSPAMSGGSGSDTMQGSTGGDRLASRPGEIETYIRDSAARHGVDPNVAVRVAKSEGGLTDPYRQGEAMLTYGREESYGPFQLHMRQGGVGVRALRDGIDPRKDWKGGVDYAMQEASQRGWGQWFGAAKAGIGDWDGIGGRRTASAAPAASSAAPEAREPRRREERSAAAIPMPEADEGSSIEEQEVSFDLPDAPIPQVSDWTEFAQLADQQLHGGPPSPPVDEEARPVLYAAQGGVIPEMHYANGGQVTGRADPYNPSRGYTQNIMPVRGKSWSPRRVGSGPVSANLSTGPTPSQQALIDARKKLAAQTPVAPVTPAAPNYTDDQRMQANINYNNALRGMQFGSRNVDRDQAGWLQTQRNRAKLRDAWMKSYGGDEGRTKWLDQFLAGDQQTQMRMSKPGLFFAEGGMVPGVDPDYWEAAERRTSMRDSGESARDRAAKRVNRAERGVTSTALGRRGEQVREKSRERGQVKRDKARLKSSTAPAPSPDRVPTPTPAPRSTVTAGLSRNPYDTQRGTPRQPDVQQTAAGRMSDENAGPGERAAAVNPVLPELEMTWPDPGIRPIQSTIDWLSGANDPELEDRITRERPGQPSGVVRPDPRQAMPQEQPPMVRRPDPIPPTGRDRFQPEVPMARPDPSQVEPPQYPPNVALPEQPGEEEPMVLFNGKMVPLSQIRYGDARRWLGFAQGGVVPEEDDEPMSPRMESAAYTTSAPGAPSISSAEQPEEPQYATVRPTKRLRDDVAKALDGGVRFLTQRFGLRGAGGAMPMPEDAQVRDEGTTRFAMGEGAATPDEISGIDDAVDPERNLSEGDRQMTRLAKTTQWYLERGRKDDAEASAAALMQYGAKRFGQLGALAGAAYNKYQQTGDPQHLENTTKFIEYAYRLIPDGGNLDISIDPETQRIQATRVGPEGDEQTYDLSPQELQGVLSQAQNSSTYWKQIFRLADPAGARADLSEQRAIARDARTDKRAEEREARIDARADAREERQIAAEGRREQRQIERDKRIDAREEKRAARSGTRQIDWNAVAPARVAAAEAKRKWEESEDEASQAEFDQAASRLFDELGKYTNDPAKAMESIGIMTEDYNYLAPAAGGAGSPTSSSEPRQAPDGKWYVKKPNGKYVEVEMEPAG